MRLLTAGLVALAVMTTGCASNSHITKNISQADRNGLTASDDLTLKKGIELYQTGNRKEAERLLAQSYESTRSVEAARYLGRVRYETGNIDGAIEPLTRAAAAFKDDIRCHYYLGMALFTVGRNAESLTAFSNALELDKDNPELLFITANLSMLNGQPKEAVELYSRIKPDSPYGGRSVYNSAEAYIMLGDFSSAAQILMYLANARPGDFTILYNLSAALIEVGDCSTAVDILMKLYPGRRDDPRIAYNLGLAYQGLGSDDKALEFLGDAVKLEPGNTDFRYAYGLELSENGRDSEAASQMKSVLEIAPDHSSAANWLYNYQNAEKQP